MTAIEIKKSVMLLPEDERAKLASDILCSLPSVLYDDDEGLAEALRREAELDRDPSSGMTMNEFTKAFDR